MTFDNSKVHAIFYDSANWSLDVGSINFAMCSYSIFLSYSFGVPPMLLGIPGDATYANYAEAHRAFYRLTVLPLATRVTAALAEWLSGYLGAAVMVKPDLDQVPALAAERDAQWARVSAAAFLSDAEKRSLLGLPAVADDA